MDINIETDQAESWKNEVETELTAVRKLLDRVSKSLQEQPTDGDNVINAIYDVGTELESTWNTLCNGFDDAIEKVGEEISALKQAIIDNRDKVLEFKNKIGQ